MDHYRSRPNINHDAPAFGILTAESFNRAGAIAPAQPPASSERHRLMENLGNVSCEERLDSDAIRTATIRCYLYPALTAPAPPLCLSLDRQLTAEAMCLLIGVDSQLLSARADWNEDRFRRLMRLRPGVVARVLRRWESVSPQPRIPLGSLRRRYHANIALYLNPVSQD